MHLLFENDACLVINKRPGESSELPELGLAKRVSFPVPVHRLDTPVSGCLLLAKNARAAAFLAAAFARNTSLEGQGGVEKRYWAVVEMPAVPIPQEAELVHWLKKDNKKNKSFALSCNNVQAVPEGLKRRLKKAKLYYRVIGSGERYLFLEIGLITGRHHQIRAQLAAEGLFIKGDLKYGARRSEKGGGIRLHAYSLAFPNPLNPPETILVKAPLQEPDSLWQSFLNQKLRLRADDVTQS